MEVFSLEEDEGNDLFITQESQNDSATSVGSILGDGLNFSTPCFSLLDSKYSDISEDEFEIPCSQKRSFSESDKKRFVILFKILMKN